MSAIIKGFIVTLKPNITFENARRLRQAIELFDGVVTVKDEPETLHDLMVREQIRDEFRGVLIREFFEEGTS